MGNGKRYEVPYGQNPYNVIGKYIRDNIEVIEDIIAVIELNGVETNELFMVDMDDDGLFVWKSDWWEGEEKVVLLDFFPVSEATHLSAEPELATDTISRQGAINALWKALFEYEDKTEKQFLESDELDVADWIQHRNFVQNMSDIDRKTILNLPSAEPETSRIEQELHGKTPEEQYEFIYWLLLKSAPALNYSNSRLAIIEWLRGEEDDCK